MKHDAKLDTNNQWREKIGVCLYYFELVYSKNDNHILFELFSTLSQPSGCGMFVVSFHILHYVYKKETWLFICLYAQKHFTGLKSACLDSLRSRLRDEPCIYCCVHHFSHFIPNNERQEQWPSVSTTFPLSNFIPVCGSLSSYRLSSYLLLRWVTATDYWKRYCHNIKVHIKVAHLSCLGSSKLR